MNKKTIVINTWDESVFDEENLLIHIPVSYCEVEIILSAGAATYRVDLPLLDLTEAFNLEGQKCGNVSVKYKVSKVKTKHCLLPLEEFKILHSMYSDIEPGEYAVAVVDAYTGERLEIDLDVFLRYSNTDEVNHGG